MKAKRKPKENSGTGKLRIGDDWSAIKIIALSQSNPLKALAELVENSIDAGAKNITNTRGKENREPYITVLDDGAGIPKNEDGIPDFHYVATHICDSVKRRLKDETNVQGEFGIGLLSFWTLGAELTLTCSGDDEQTYRMSMRSGDADYRLGKNRALFPSTGTELKVKPLLPGLRQLSGEKIQWYLASELRDRIRTNNVQVTVRDRTARKEFNVRPREFSGQLIRDLPPVKTRDGETYVELYLCDPKPEHKVGLYRNGTRVLADIVELEGLKTNVWSSGYLEGIVDVPSLNLTPGTRLGVIRDEKFARAWYALRPVEDYLESIITELRKAEEERASKHLLKSIQKAFREALLALPPEEYDWFDIQSAGDRKPGNVSAEQVPILAGDSVETSSQTDESRDTPGQKEFFQYAGPLFSARISPASSVVKVGKTRTLRGLSRDKSGRTVEHGLRFNWQVMEGAMSLENADSEIVTAVAGREPGLAKIMLTISQEDMQSEAFAHITMTDSLDDAIGTGNTNRAGLPGYTYLHAAGELWRSRYDEEQNFIVINNGHRDFVYSSKSRSLKMRYIARLFAKELVLKNFPGLPSAQMLERMIELSLYTEENLK